MPEVRHLGHRLCRASIATPLLLGGQRVDHQGGDLGEGLRVLDRFRESLGAAALSHPGGQFGAGGAAAAVPFDVEAAGDVGDDAEVGDAAEMPDFYRVEFAPGDEPLDGGAADAEQPSSLISGEESHFTPIVRIGISWLLPFRAAAA
jgi:hypothetical protein